MNKTISVFVLSLFVLSLIVVSACGAPVSSESEIIQIQVPGYPGFMRWILQEHWNLITQQDPNLSQTFFSWEKTDGELEWYQLYEDNARELPGGWLASPILVTPTAGVDIATVIALTAQEPGGFSGMVTPPTEIPFVTQTVQVGQQPFPSPPVEMTVTPNGGIFDDVHAQQGLNTKVPAQASGTPQAVASGTVSPIPSSVFGFGVQAVYGDWLEIYGGGEYDSIRVYNDPEYSKFMRVAGPKSTVEKQHIFAEVFRSEMRIKRMPEDLIAQVVETIVDGRPAVITPRIGIPTDYAIHIGLITKEMLPDIGEKTLKAYMDLYDLSRVAFYDAGIQQTSYVEESGEIFVTDLEIPIPEAMWATPILSNRVKYEEHQRYYIMMDVDDMLQHGSSMEP